MSSLLDTFVKQLQELFTSYVTPAGCSFTKKHSDAHQNNFRKTSYFNLFHLFSDTFWFWLKSGKNKNNGRIKRRLTSIHNVSPWLVFGTGTCFTLFGSNG